jgi:hypothetical protein
MSNERNPELEPDNPLVYEIRLTGRLDRHWADWFGAVRITLDEQGDTLLTCSVADQAALHGLLRKVRDLGLPLQSVVRIHADSTR